MKTASALIMALALLSLTVRAQDINFSMYHHSPMASNPGMLGMQHGTELLVNYRNQAIDVGANFQSSQFSFFHPFNVSGNRLVVGASFVNDQPGNALSNNGGLLALAYSVQLTKYNELSLGLQSGFFGRSTGGTFTTDDQFVNGIFDPNSTSGDPLLNRSTSYIGISPGLFWRMYDERHHPLAFVGFSIFNLNRPDIAFTDQAMDRLPMSAKFIGGFTLFQGQKSTITPTMRWIHQAGQNVLNIGSRFGYTIVDHHHNFKQLGFGLWYNTNKLAVLSAEYSQSGVTVAMSYDLPLSNQLSMGGGTIFELALSYALPQKSGYHSTLPWRRSLR
ncbi:MAG: PorP/SprF family type IX secretion system membrane protein [Cyclobacteriaceae bacterium]